MIVIPIINLLFSSVRPHESPRVRAIGRVRARGGGEEHCVIGEVCVGAGRWAEPAVSQ